MTERRAENREIPYHVGESRLRRERQAGSGRKEMMDLFGRTWKLIVQDVGSVLASAQQVLVWAHELGHLEHLKKANGVGDVLGNKGFKLPYAYRKNDGKRRYLMPAISWSEEDREKFFELLPEQMVSRVRSLEKELLGIDMDAYEKEVAETFAKIREAEEDSPEHIATDMTSAFRVDEEDAS